MLAAAALATAAPAEALDPPYEATRHGARCDLVPDGSLHCEYAVGEDLRFELRRVGEPDVALRILHRRSPADYDADGEMLGGCVFVRHGARGRAAGGSDFTYAFVSARNGFVYRELRACRDAR